MQISAQSTLTWPNSSYLTHQTQTEFILQIRSYYACALNLDIGLVQLNYSLNLATMAPRTWGKYDPCNSLPFLLGAGAPTVVSSQPVGYLPASPAFGGIVVWFTLTVQPDTAVSVAAMAQRVPVSATPNPGNTSDLASLTYARALALTAQLNAMIEDIAINGTASSNPLSYGQRNLAQMIAAIAGMNPAAVFSQISNAPAIVLTPPPSTPDAPSGSSASAATIIVLATAAASLLVVGAAAFYAARLKKRPALGCAALSATACHGTIEEDPGEIPP